MDDKELVYESSLKCAAIQFLTWFERLYLTTSLWIATYSVFIYLMMLIINHINSLQMGNCSGNVKLCII